MIIRHDQYLILSANSNTDYWATNVYPDWATLTGIVYVADGRIGDGIEPHYHDCDEFWIFCVGKGEGWMDGQTYETTPNTAVYNPMGVIHRHQQFTPFAAAGLITHRERQHRSGHLAIDKAGLPEPTIPGFVVSGAQNTREGLDTFISIEDLIGSKFADTLFGTASANQFVGGAA